MKQNISNGGIGLLLIYKNFTERLIPKNVGPIKEYDFDSSNPDYTSHFQMATIGLSMAFLPQITVNG